MKSSMNIILLDQLFNKIFSMNNIIKCAFSLSPLIRNQPPESAPTPEVMEK
jgi:hypothetical protein